MEARRQEIEKLNEHYDEVIDEIRDPGKKEREDRAFRENPLFAAGLRGLDRLKWDFNGGQMAAARLQEQGL